MASDAVLFQMARDAGLSEEEAVASVAEFRTREKAAPVPAPTSAPRKPTNATPAPRKPTNAAQKGDNTTPPMGGPKGTVTQQTPAIPGATVPEPPRSGVAFMPSPGAARMDDRVTIESAKDYGESRAERRERSEKMLQGMQKRVAPTLAVVEGVVRGAGMVEDSYARALGYKSAEEMTEREAAKASRSKAQQAESERRLSESVRRQIRAPPAVVATPRARIEAEQRAAFEATRDFVEIPVASSSVSAPAPQEGVASFLPDRYPQTGGSVRAQALRRERDLLKTIGNYPFDVDSMSDEAVRAALASSRVRAALAAPG